MGLPYVRTVRSGRSLHLLVTPHTLTPPGHRRHESQIQNCHALAQSWSSYSEYSTFGADLCTSSPFAAHWREYRTVQKAVQTRAVQNRSWEGQEEGRRAGHLHKHSSELSLKLHVRANFTHQSTSTQKHEVHTWCKPWNMRVLPFFKGGPHLGHKKILSVQKSFFVINVTALHSFHDHTVHHANPRGCLALCWFTAEVLCTFCMFAQCLVLSWEFPSKL